MRRKNTINVYTNDDEKYLFKKESEKMGVSVSTFFRMAGNKLIEVNKKSLDSPEADVPQNGNNIRAF